MVSSCSNEQEILEIPEFIRNAYLRARHEGKQEGLREGEAKGCQEGEEKGFRQAKIDSLMQVMHLRFDIDVHSFENTALQAIFSTMDRQMLDKALEKAIGVQSLDDMKVWLSSPDA